MVNHGIKIAKAGYDYDDGDRRLILNTRYPFLKIKAHGSGSHSFTGGSGTITLNTHNLGYKPFFKVFTEYVDVNTGNKVSRCRQCSWRDYYGLGIFAYYYAYPTTTQLILDVYTAWGVTKTLNYLWVVYYDPLS